MFSVRNGVHMIPPAWNVEDMAWNRPIPSAPAATGGIDATHYNAEQAIRPVVVNRKGWAGNRTSAGAAQALSASWASGLRHFVLKTKPLDAQSRRAAVLIAISRRWGPGW